MARPMAVVRVSTENRSSTCGAPNRTTTPSTPITVKADQLGVSPDDIVAKTREKYIEAYEHLNLKLTTGIYGSTFFMLTSNTVTECVSAPMDI